MRRVARERWALGAARGPVSRAVRERRPRRTPGRLAGAGVHAPEVAERAGHGVDVLLRVYAKCIDGQHETANKRIMEALTT
ncbi:hypothetical protein GCM10010126_52220 [Planomonospora parontospora]|uniref:Integrase n=1 Tax=Planomonospora parontospora TaxID=58119 RepID=A0AA37BKL3_9ACTN|nr:hypothetical protein GCM10010126_52220 [Planomonospora parontospora]